MLLCVTALLPVSSQACAHLCSCASFSPRFSQLFWFLSAAAALSNSCTQQSCQVRSLYFHCFLLTDFFQTDLVVLTLSLVVGRRHLYLLLSGFRPCTVSLALSLNCKKPSILVVFAFLFYSSKNRGIMRRYMQTWRDTKRIPVFTLAAFFSSQGGTLTWSTPAFCTFQI